MEIRRDVLPKGRSYPLRASILEALLREADVRTSILLHQRSVSWWTEGVLMRGDFHPPGQFRRDEREILRITCRSVPSGDRPMARMFLEAEALPALVAWIGNIERLLLNSPIRREKQAFTKEWPTS